MKVLQVIRQGQIGGGETHLIDLVKNFNPSIVESHVLSFTDGPMVDTIRSLNIPCTVIPSKRVFDRSIKKKIKFLIKDEDIDIVHAHGTRAMSNIYWIKERLNLPLIYTIHGWSFHDGQMFFMRYLRIISEQYLTSKSTMNISVSKSNQETGKKNLFSFSSEVIYNGVDCSKFNAEKTYPNIREELGISTDAPLIAYIARFTYQKAPILLLKAIKQLIKKHSDVILLMVGHGELYNKVVSFIDSNNLQNNVILTNYRHDIPALLNDSDIYCLPSRWEGLPIGLLEAMAMKKAIVASRVDGNKEVIKDGHNGLIIEKNHIGQLCDALDILINNPHLREMLAQNALQTVLHKYTTKLTAKKVEELYQQFY